MSRRTECERKKKTLAEARALIRSGDIIAVSGAITEPVVFLGRRREINPRSRRMRGGVAYLRGRSVRERAEQLISIAHPDFRGELRAEARKLGYVL